LVPLPPLQKQIVGEKTGEMTDATYVHDQHAVQGSLSSQRLKYIGPGLRLHSGVAMQKSVMGSME
jgi:hypothetical protein